MPRTVHYFKFRHAQKKNEQKINMKNTMAMQFYYFKKNYRKRPIAFRLKFRSNSKNLNIQVRKISMNIYKILLIC